MFLLPSSSSESVLHAVSLIYLCICLKLRQVRVGQPGRSSCETDHMQPNGVLKARSSGMWMGNGLRAVFQYQLFLAARRPPQNWET